MCHSEVTDVHTVEPMLHVTGLQIQWFLMTKREKISGSKALSLIKKSVKFQVFTTPWALVTTLAKWPDNFLQLDLLICRKYWLYDRTIWGFSLHSRFWTCRKCHVNDLDRSFIMTWKSQAKPKRSSWCHYTYYIGVLLSFQVPLKFIPLWLATRIFVQSCPTTLANQ